MSANENWDFDGLENGIQKMVGENQLRLYGRFLEQYGQQLLGIREALEGYVNNAWDMFTDPVGLKYDLHEHTTLLELISTDNKVLNKVLIVFASLCSETRRLRAEARTKYFNAVLFYGEGVDEGSPDEAAQLQLSRFLPLLQNLWCFVQRCGQVALCTVRQLAAYYSPVPAAQVMSSADVHFQDVVDHLADLLLVLATLDETLCGHAVLLEHWALYRQTVKSVRHDPSRVGVPPGKLALLEGLLADLETSLLTGKIFQRAVEQVADGMRADGNRDGLLGEELQLYVRASLAALEARPAEQLHGDAAALWVKAAAVHVLHFRLFGVSERRLLRQLWELHRKIPAVTLVGNALWFPEHFLADNLPHFSKLVDKKAVQAAVAGRHAFLQAKSQSLSREAQQLTFQIALWSVQLEATLKQESTSLKLEDLSHRCNLYLQGLQHAGYVRCLAQTLTNLHVSLSRPMPKTAVASLCRLVELVKGVQQAFHRHGAALYESVNHVAQYLAFQALSVISATKRSLVQDKRYSEKHLDILSSLALAERALHGPGSADRRLVARLALATARHARLLREDEQQALAAALGRLDAACELQGRLAAACDCCFLYWHRAVLPAYFGALFRAGGDLRRLAILKPLCQEIETNLRLHVHSHLQVNERNPFQTEISDPSALLRLQSLKYLDKRISVEARVEQYLDQTFYNLTTVALHDWRTYGEMRSLAQHKFGLRTVEDHLPSQTLEQGLDVLEIMRNINIFVSKYLYNLNNQIFVEQSSNNKHLNTINIRHVANSIRTHGIGIMNTTVNFTYQYLRKQFFIFSQFMFDEHIKSRLIKDLRFFRENKVQLDQKYSYERAEKFNRGIRKLGLTADGKSYLDQFRMLISHIGNAMGYVRMIRSGGLHCCSDAISFVPDLDDIPSFKDLCERDRLSEVCVEAAERLDQVIGNLVRNFTEGTEYFKLLVDVFAPAFRDPKNMHLRNFHIIVPPLTINFVEHSITCKEKMSKKNKVGAAFTDDGFAMGIAYILNLLDQYEVFDSLHWFQSVRDKYLRDKLALRKQKSLAVKDDEKLQQTMSLTARRLDMYQEEFTLLYYSLSSARVFFCTERAGADEVDKSGAQDNSIPN
ncbi:WASH complex subunit 4 isoform X2 [Bacillus rossius redtenbacheri]|uniref:WASH complex subunit 4 isoform X2 n=1 Tax=Bacillus rossius redtenbacheri TaxID=93214 RepID=UPI002FDD435F